MGDRWTAKLAAALCRAAYPVAGPPSPLPWPQCCAGDTAGWAPLGIASSRMPTSRQRLSACQGRRSTCQQGQPQCAPWWGRAEPARCTAGVSGALRCCALAGAALKFQLHSPCPLPLPLCASPAHAGDCTYHTCGFKNTDAGPTAGPLRADIFNKSQSFEQVSVGGKHACAVEAGGKHILCWGVNDWGQLGEWKWLLAQCA